MRAALMAALSAAVWVLPVCAHANNIVHAEVSNAALISALKNIKRALTESRTEFSFDNGAKAQSCLDYLNLLPTVEPLESVRNFEVGSEYLLCDSIKIISQQSFTAQKKNLTQRPARVLYEKLDLRSFPSSLRNQTDEHKFTLKALFPGQVKFQGSALQIDTGTQFFQLNVVGVLHHGLTQDWLVWVTDEMKEGNYKSYRTMVVKVPSAPARLYTGTLFPDPSL